MRADSGWQYFDVEMRHTRRLRSFVTDINIITLYLPTNIKHSKLFLCYVFSTLYTAHTAQLIRLQTII